MANSTDRANQEGTKTTDRAIRISDTPVENTDEPIISDLPQGITESYGTGTPLEPGIEIGGRTMNKRMEQYTSTSPELTGGDPDARWDQAHIVGDEAVGGTVSTPDQDTVDELGTAVGLEYDDQVFLRTNDRLEERDSSRWELDPKSSSDYQERRD